MVEPNVHVGLVSHIDVAVDIRAVLDCTASALQG